MTTHNPLTLSFVPIENVFIVSNESVAEPVGYVQSIQLLTQNLVCLNEPFRLVFVEANDDKVFYEMILMFLRNLDQKVLRYPISFLSLGLSSQSEDSATRNYLDSKNVVRDLVGNFVTKLDNIQFNEDDKKYLETKSDEIAQTLIESKSIVDNQK